MRPAESPTPEQLAAYADGELDGRDSLAPLREHIERWLEHHPEARAELEEHRRLRRACDMTSPSEPSEVLWSRILARLAQVRPEPVAPRTTARRVVWIAAGAVAAAILFVVLQGQPPAPVPQPAAVDQTEEDTALLDDGEPLQVATADEIEILSVDGADAHTLAVHDLPTRGPIELLRPGEVSLAQPMRDPMMQVRLEGPATPMIWARLDSEMDDDDD